MKICQKCKKYKSLNEFYKVSQSTKLRSYCKECMLLESCKRQKFLRKTNPSWRKIKNAKKRIWYQKNLTQQEKYRKQSYLKNKKYYIKKATEWRLNNLEYVKKLRAIKESIYRKKYPWAKTLNGIRCRIRNNKYYQKFKNYLTLNDIKKLWFRDKAYLMDKPCIHRINNQKGYFFDNCQYINYKQHILLHKIKND